MNRRDLLRLGIAGSATLVLCKPSIAIADEHGSSQAASDDPPLARAVDAGRRYFVKRCDDQLPTVLALESAIRSGDLDAAKHAYIEARPPYEEIETLAASFEQSDRDIDARPYAFEGGEDDAEFRGFHKIEAMLFGYEELPPAVPFATHLVESVRSLRRELDQPERFSAAGQFGGMITLANEVSAKKVSSEEETWSDQTLLIFRHNWIGIYSQYIPFDELVKRSRPSASEAVTRAYDSAMALLGGHFRPGSAAGTPYSTIGVADRRKMADASNRLRDALSAAAASLRIEPA
ncbi:MAG: EfeM/EfeO family lipoprotein [Planctomycetota bacterium]